MMEIGQVSEISCFKKLKIMANVQNDNQAKGLLCFVELLMNNFDFFFKMHFSNYHYRHSLLSRGDITYGFKMRNKMHKYHCVIESTHC